MLYSVCSHIIRRTYNYEFMKYKAAISNIYQQLNNGDINAIIDLLTEDVEWTTSEKPAATPLSGTRRGKKAVSQLLYSLGSLKKQMISPPHLLIEENNCVVALGKAEGLDKISGKAIVYDWVHAWFLNKEGKVERFHSYLDSAREAVSDSPVPSAR